LNPYRITGIVLVVIGLGMASCFYIGRPSVPLIAIGLSAMVLGFTSLGLSQARPRFSSEAGRIFMQAEMRNTAALLQELKLHNRAVYLPRSSRNGYSQALVPLVTGLALLDAPELLNGHLIMRGLHGSEAVAVAVTTPGNLALSLLPGKPGDSVDEISSSLKYILTEALNIAKRVKVERYASRLKIEVIGAENGDEEKTYYRCLGSPIASIAAAICCEALEKPVRITEESHKNDRNQITLEILT
jgi:hypothetical protein